MLYSSLPALLAVALCANAAHVTHPTTTPAPDAERLKKLEMVTEQLARQLMLQQLYVEEKTRSDGDSGIKQLRMRTDGDKTYDTDSFVGRSVAAVHDHSNLERTVGLGEMTAVLNGLEFRTRHNDYKLRMPVHNNTYHAMEDIPFPPVPPSVLAKHGMEAQAAELREYFKAWADSNVTHRDYRPYFKANLCIMEGAWTLDKHIDEPFSSDRHAIDASSWFDLQEKVRYTSNTGDRLNTQNLAYLPTTITNITDGVPEFAQWNYRIMCHPLKAQVNMSQMVPIDDFAHRLAYKRDMDGYQKTRMVRYALDDNADKNSFYQWGQMDDWMYEIPGKDNYGAHKVDDVFGLPKLTLDMSEHINVAHYHRRWKVGAHDAMGDTIGHRGYKDRTLWVAENSQSRIAKTHIHHCYRSAISHKHVCDNVDKRVSYAFPLELVFTTPLQTWNPYNIENKGKFNKPEAVSVSANGRTGGTTLDKAYNGTHSKSYYYTPVEFFQGAEVAHDPADTTKAATGVLDRQGNLRLLKSSGIRTVLPNIGGVGSLRTRYPLMPVTHEGTAVWKEMEAVRDVVMDLEGHTKYMKTVPDALHKYTASPSHHGK